MQFLIDEDLPNSATELFKKYGHEAKNVRDIGLRGAKDAEVIAYAKKQKLCLVTADFDFSNIRNYPPREYSGIIVLTSLPRNTTAKFLLNLLEQLLKQKELIENLSGKLAIVQPECIRIRRD